MDSTRPVSRRVLTNGPRATLKDAVPGRSPASIALMSGGPPARTLRTMASAPTRTPRMSAGSRYGLFIAPGIRRSNRDFGAEAQMILHPPPVQRNCLHGLEGFLTRSSPQVGNFHF